MRRPFKVDSLFILMAICLISCSEQEEKEFVNRIGYYSKLTGIISPYLEYNPRGEISEDSILFFTHYQVVSGKEGKLQEITYFVNGKPNNESYYGTHKVSYEYSDSTMSRTYYDEKNRKSYLWRHYYQGRNIHKEVFYLDSNGNKSKLILLDSLGKRVSTGLGAYEYQWQTLSDTAFVQKQFDRDGKPNILTNYFPFYTSKITIDDKGDLYGIYNVNDVDHKIEMNSSTGYAKVIFDFDIHGNEMGWEFHDTEGNLVNRSPIENTDYGYAQWLYENNVWEDRKKGLLKYFEQNLYNATGEPANDNDSIHKTTYFLNDNFQLDSILRYNKYGIPQGNMSTNIFRTEFKYDPDGNRVDVVDYDIDGNVIKG
nr:hypothetical protein [uncultured Allomuricauda sp.]